MPRNRVFKIAMPWARERCGCMPSWHQFRWPPDRYREAVRSARGGTFPGIARFERRKSRPTPVRRLR
jgi:hypothetical protein